MQLPVASRYGIAKVPGLTWTGDFYTTLNVHYILAALLLALGLYWLTLQVRGRLRGRLAYWGKVRLAVLGVVVLSGMDCFGGQRFEPVQNGFSGDPCEFPQYGF